MATEIVHWCDWHISDEGSPRVLATSSHATAFDGTEYLLELCEECETKRYQPLMSFAQTFGVRAKPEPSGRVYKPKRPPHPLDQGGTTCRICGREFGGRASLGIHLARAHEVPGIFAMWEAVERGDA